MFDFLEKIPEFLKFGWSDLAKIFIGAFMVGFMAWGWVRSTRKTTKAQIRSEELRREVESAKERAEFHGVLADLKTQHSEEVMQLREQLIEAEHCQNIAEAE